MRSTLALSIAAVFACEVARAPASDVPAAVPVPAPAPDVEAPPPAAPALHEIPIADVGMYTLALAQAEQGALLFASEPDGIGRFALDLDARTATRTEVIAVDRYPHAVAYEHAEDRLWWVATLEQERSWQPSSGGFPRGELVVTNSSVVGHGQGLRATVRLCPSSHDPGGEWLCDHEICELLPAFGGVLLGGRLAERVGRASADGWLGFVDASGVLTAEHRIPASVGPTWIGALAQSEAGVLAVVWSGRGEPARASFLLFDGPTLGLQSSADRSTPSWVASPWSAAVAAADGSFWVALTTSRHELTIVSIARDGSIAAEHPIDGAELPIASVQSLGLRGGQPWLLIAKQYDQPSLWASRIDPATGAVEERHSIALPTELVPERLLASERGVLLAGRVKLERSIAVWVALGE